MALKAYQFQTIKMSFIQEYFKKRKQQPEQVTIPLTLTKTIPIDMAAHVVETLKPTVTLDNVVTEQPDYEFSTIDAELVFKLQNKFTIRSVYYDKNNGGMKTYVFNATKHEIDKYLKEE